jgi:hypothetical protein
MHKTLPPRHPRKSTGLHSTSQDNYKLTVRIPLLHTLHDDREDDDDDYDEDSLFSKASNEVFYSITATNAVTKIILC